MSKIIAIRAIDWSAILGIAKNKTFAINAVCDYAFFEAFWRSRIFENMSVSEKNFSKKFSDRNGSSTVRISESRRTRKSSFWGLR